MSIINEVVAYLDQGGDFAGAERRFLNYLVCYRILQAHDDPRADRVLQTAHTQLQEQAERITDVEHATPVSGERPLASGDRHRIRRTRSVML